MRRINIENLKEGMIISKPIYTNNGIILLSEGSKLTNRYIDKIHNTGLKYIYIEDKLSKGIMVEELISDKTRLETKKVLNESISKIKSGYFNVSESIIKKVEEIINEVMLNPRVMFSIQEIRNKSDYLQMHSINVCVISLLIGKKMDLFDTQLKHLAIGALLHDIGKIYLDFDDIKYRDEYKGLQFELYKNHADEGFDILRNIPDISMISATIVRTHHEKYDGSGFPLGLKEDAIHMFSKIVAVANEYDNLLYNMPKGFEMKNHEIIEYITAKTFTEFDPEVVKIFIKSISPYPLSTGVKLSDGRIGIVSKINPKFPTRPTIRIINDDTLENMEEIDLSETLSLLIVEEKELCQEWEIPEFIKIYKK